MKKAFVSSVAIVAIVVAGTGLVSAAKTFRNRNPVSDADTTARVPNVKVQVLEAAPLEDHVLLTGSIEPWEEVELSAQVAGRIEWQGIEEGDQVAEGQELIRIDTDSIRARLDQARAQQKLAVQELARIENLQKEGISSPQALDRALADRDVAAATVRATEVELAASVLTAPFAAVVDTLTKEEAEYVTKGTPLVRLVQVQTVKVEVGIPERDIPAFSKGDAVAVTVDALPGKTFAGQVYRIATTADKHTRTFLAEIELDNADGPLKPGMIARARMVRRTYEDAISIPIFAVIALDDGYQVFVEDGGIAQPRDVEVGVFRDDVVHVTRGLEAGDRLIVVGQRELRAGDRIHVAEELGNGDPQG